MDNKPYNKNNKKESRNNIFMSAAKNNMNNKLQLSAINENKKSSFNKEGLKSNLFNIKNNNIIDIFQKRDHDQNYDKPIKVKDSIKFENNMKIIDTKNQQFDLNIYKQNPQNEGNKMNYQYQKNNNKNEYLEDDNKIKKLNRPSSVRNSMKSKYFINKDNDSTLNKDYKNIINNNSLRNNYEQNNNNKNTNLLFNQKYSSNQNSNEKNSPYNQNIVTIIGTRAFLDNNGIEELNKSELEKNKNNDDLKDDNSKVKNNSSNINYTKVKLNENNIDNSIKSDTIIKIEKNLIKIKENQRYQSQQEY